MARYRTALLAAAAATATALVTAGTASATPEEDAYLATLANTPGFTVNPFTSMLLVGAGNGYCADLRGGVPVDEVYGKAMAYPGATNVGARQMVDAAQQSLCPDTRGQA